MAIHHHYLLLLLLLLLVCWIPSLATAADSINQTQFITDADGVTIVSSGGVFELGFFSPGSSTARYVGIWYKDVPVKTVVWVANRDKPINGSSGVLKVNTTGNLVILGQNGTLVWSGNSTGLAGDVILQLLDNGNLVLRDGSKGSSSENYLWQSFDYPSDTFLPWMKIGKNLRTGHEWSYTSWKSPNDPSPGDYTWTLENLDYPELIGRKDSVKYFSSGPWTGLRFSQFSSKTPTTDLFSFYVVSNQDEVYYIYHPKNTSLLSRAVVNQTTAKWERSSWDEPTQSWRTFMTFPSDYCDSYALCGIYAKCQIDALPYCQCLKGFSPRFPDKWVSNDWSSGCVRDDQLSCTTRYGFSTYPGLKLPDSTNASVDSSSNLKDCRARCSSNCSCMAYANSEFRGVGSGCVMWFNDLIDMKDLPGGGQDIYIRMPASELGKTGFEAWKIAVIVLVIATAAAMLAAIFYLRKKSKERRRGHIVEEPSEERPNDDLEFPSFDLATIAKATSDFSMQNKLGEGGFGPVYKGILVDGKEIAVKRLSSSSTQGMKEFKNEVLLIANLQHRNLVKLLGCCIHKEERMLIYEYMPNGSLDSFIFDRKRSKLLDWGKRFHIMCGVARGLLYLHQDSRLRIIHRDLKASNVLLDDGMNPKISDFGMARMFGGDETEGNTKRVVGTYGYMAPEYAIEGLFSVKSDVFSFGVLVLETISGRKNTVLCRSDHNLIGYAWNLHKEGRSTELIDTCFMETCPAQEVLRCIHIALLCLQEYPEDRPSMPSVVMMLNGEGTLPPPRSPRFLVRKQFAEHSSSSTDMASCSNDMTITIVEAR